MLASEFLLKLAKLQESDLDSIKGFGPILAKNVVEFTKSQRFQNLYQNFLSIENQNIYLDISNSSKNKVTTGPLIDEVICITGSFDIPREQIKSQLQAYGATTVDSVTKKTTILLVGEEAGSKLEKAQQLGIKILLSLDELKRQYNLN